MKQQERNKTKRVFWGFFALDYQTIAAYLEEMAEKGWMLEKAGRETAKFRAIEPRKLKFYVDVFKDEGPLTPENTRESEEYRNLCQASGWTFITSQDYLQFFYADGLEDPVPIQTDEALEQRIVESTLFKRELLSALLFFMIGTAALVMQYPLKYHSMLSFAGVVSVLLFPILFVAMLASAVYSVVRVLKARRNINRGLPLDKPTLKNARRRIVAFYGTVLTIVGLTLLAFMVDAYFDPSNLLPLLGPATGTVIGLCLRHFIKKKSTDRNSSVAYVVLTILLIMFSIAIANSLLSSRPFSATYRIDPLPKEVPLVTMEELVEPSQQRNLSIREFSRGMSPATPLHYEYWEVWEMATESEGLRVRYYQTLSPGIAQMIFEGITGDLARGIKFQGNYFFVKNMVTDEEMRAAWKMDHLALTEERDELILHRGNTVVHLSGDLDFDDARVRALITDRFFPDEPVHRLSDG